MRVFEGYEAEGRFRGLWTLFVAGDVPFEEIEKRLDRTNQSKPYNQVYFGADNCSTVNWETVKQCRNYYGLIITAEVKDPVPFFPAIDHMDNLTIMIPVQKTDNLDDVIDSIKCNVSTVQIKFETDRSVYVCCLSDFVDNSKIEYSQDKELWRQ